MRRVPAETGVGAGDFSINTFNLHHRQRGDGQGSSGIDLYIIVLNKKTYNIVGSSVVLFNILGENPASLRSVPAELCSLVSARTAVTGASRSPE